MRLSLPISLALAALLAAPSGMMLAAPSASAHEVVPAEKRILPFSSDLPLCGDPSVLEKISIDFAVKEAKFWNSALTLVEYERIAPAAYRPWGTDLIPRRYCTATATTSDGLHHRVDYSVREDLGFLGVGWGVEFCVQGLDRNAAYSPACRMARP